MKSGKCLDCPEGSPDKPLIAKRCNYHYWNYRDTIKKSKNKQPQPIKRIPKISKKRIVENAKYTVKRLEFLGKSENNICPITGYPTTDIHHKMGRIGFADEWARINGISLLLDCRFWLAVSRSGHQKIEENPKWAKKMGYSLNRI